MQDIPVDRVWLPYSVDWIFLTVILLTPKNADHESQDDGNNIILYKSCIFFATNAADVLIFYCGYSISWTLWVNFQVRLPAEF